MILPYRLPVFLTGHSANALSIGVQMVLVGWLAAGVLKLSATGVAFVQACVLAPNLLLILFAGALTDRHHPAKILFVTNIALSLLHGTAFLLLRNGQMDALTLMLYAFGLGCGNSFIQTSREKLIGILDSRLKRNISVAGICQHLAQAAGIAVASLTDILGASYLILMQAGLCFVAFAAYGNLSAKEGVSDKNPSMPLAPAIQEAMSFVWRTVAIRHLIVVVAFNGFMHLGMFLVLLPILVRDYLGFSSVEYGLLQLSFTFGSVVAFWVIWHKARVQHPGQSVLFCLMYTAVIGLALAARPTVEGLFGLIFLWGCVAGASANLSRLVLQSVVQVETRGRVMSIYQLALFGMAPLGALCAGTLVQLGGVKLTFQVIAGGSFLLFAASLFSRPLWAVQPQDDVLDDLPKDG